MFDQIEKLKQQYTDKFVVVRDDHTPELKRFVGLTGQVKTVNMNGRALVQFDAYNNIAWYDINLDFLKVIDAPLPKVETKEEKKPAAKTTEAPAAPAEKAPAVAKAPAAPAAKKASTADILAAARAKTAAPATASAPVAKAPAPAAPKPASAPPKPATPAAAKPAAPPPAPTPAPKPASPAKSAGPSTTADKIAWCRTHDAKG